MSFLSFIKDRNQPPVTPETKQPETAKQMYSRESGQDKSGAARSGNLSPDQQAKITEAKNLFREGTEKVAERSASPAIPSEGATAPQPMMQKSMSQDTAAPALSPTSAQQGTRSTEQVAASKSKEPTKPTIARHTPSWER